MEKKSFKIVKVDYKYCDYLRKFDSKVPYNAGSKELRPFLGVFSYIYKKLSLEYVLFFTKKIYKIKSLSLQVN